MNFEDWYSKLPEKIQRYVKTFALHPTESNKGFITGYMLATQDCGCLSSGLLSFWYTWSIKVIKGLESAEKYFE
jgi:hypothetical protein